MPIESVFWAQGSGADFHLVPGLSSPPLNQLLMIRHDGHSFRADNPPAGVAVVFGQTFVPGSLGTRGVEVDGATGQVTVASPLSPHPRLLDFLVTGNVTDGAHTFPAYIRFHIHSGITRMWLTPAQLTVREGASDVRFSVLAEFVDGTYGDVSNWSPWLGPGPQDCTFVHLSASNPQPLVTWGSNAIGALDVQPRTGVLTCRPAATTAQIEAITPLIHGIATGQALRGPAWSTSGLIPLPGEGFLPPDTAPNVLILSEGFTLGERQMFIDLARLLVRRLAVGARTSPFRELSGRINYFAAYVPSRESGISPLSPVERVLVPPDPATATEVQVGVPAANVGTTPPTIAVPTTPATNTRFLINELDTAFGVVLGERPQAQRFAQIQTASPSPRRFNEQDFDDFLLTLNDPAGNNVGKHWKRGGKDEVAILVLCRSDHYGGANNFRLGSGSIICLPLGVEQKFHIQPAAGPPGQDVIADPVPVKIHVELRTRAAHELAHSFTLADEYGGGGALPPSFEGEIETKANVQARDPGPAPAGEPPRRGLLTAGNLDADLIKWRWPRIAKADVLSAPITPAGVGHRLPLRPGHPFTGGEVVRLRTFPLPTSGTSERLEVRKPVGVDHIDVDPVGPALAGTFPPGSRVIEPKRAPDPAGGLGDDLELVHVGVRNWIGSTSNHVAGHQNPLNADSTLGPGRICPGPEPKKDPRTGVRFPSTPARNYPLGAAPIPPAESAWITGLFEMGRGFDCGVYHPTGACIMGVHSFDDGASSFQFCWVCRYAMVDFIDPSLHGEIDAGYADRYPT